MTSSDGGISEQNERLIYEEDISMMGNEILRHYLSYTTDADVNVA